MIAPAHPAKSPALGGWRANVWALALFVALFKGLIPHTALAAALMQGSPALLWCAPGAQGAESSGQAEDGMPGAAHACVCASAGESMLPGKVAPLPATHAQRELLPPLLHAAALVPRLLLPPARGPPLL